MDDLTDPLTITVNPFVSEAQRRACYAAHDPNWDCAEWERHTKGRSLPSRKGGKGGGRGRRRRIAANKRRLTANRGPRRGISPNKYDPTRTSTLRRAFVARLRKRFALLKGRIVKHIGEGDALGLKDQPRPEPTVLTTPTTNNPGQIRDETGLYGPGIGIEIPREQMPQIAASDLPRLETWLRGRGVPAAHATAAADSLAPTQSRFKQSKVDAMGDGVLDDPIIVSQDNYVLDGTHRWVRAWQSDPTTPLPVLRVGLPVRDAVSLLRSFPLADYATNAGQGARAGTAVYRSFLHDGRLAYLAVNALVEVPDVRQHDSYSCGAAAAMSVGRYFGVGPESITEWKSLLDTDKRDGTDVVPLVAYLRSLGLGVRAGTGMTLDDLKRHTSAGLPVIVAVQDWGPSVPTPSSVSNGHYLVVIGVDHGYVFVQDPAVHPPAGGIQAPGRKMIEEDRFDSLWHDTDADGSILDHWGAVVSAPEPMGNYDPSQPRGHGGRWTKGSGAALAPLPPSPPPVPAIPRARQAPNVEKDSDGDGITDTARVGVPGNAVPPPPPIPALPNLSPREREVEQSFIRAYEADPDKVAANYRSLVTSQKPPPTFATDDSKVLTEEWSHPDPAERSVNRATLNNALHQTANAIAKRAFLQHLDTMEPGQEILVTVGGCGAGKGFALKNVPEALALKSRSHAVWDSAGDQNATENPWIQREAEARGLRVNYVYVDADPVTQWGHPDRGVLKRAQDPNDGRMVDASVFADSYVIGASNMRTFHDQHKDNPNASFVFLENRGTPRQIDHIPDPGIDRHELRDYAASVAAMCMACPPHVKAGATQGARIWTANADTGTTNARTSHIPAAALAAAALSAAAGRPPDPDDPELAWWREDADRLNALGEETRRRQLTVNYHPDQPRDRRGRFGSGSGDTAPTAVAQTSTPAFRAWFKDSTVTHEDGSPRVVYHGTTADFDTFKFGHEVDPHSNLDEMLGAHFAEDPTLAESFVQERGGWDRDPGVAEGGRLLPVYLSLQNPRVAPQRIVPATGELEHDATAINRDIMNTVMPHDKELFTAWAQRSRMLTAGQAGEIFDRLGRGESIGGHEYNGLAAHDVHSKYAVPGEHPVAGFMRNYDSAGMMLKPHEKQHLVDRYKEILQSQGYDGIVYTDTAPMEKGKTSQTAYIAFRPQQVKSASGNKGTFDPTSPSILNWDPDQPRDEHGRFGSGGGGSTAPSSISSREPAGGEDTEERHSDAELSGAGVPRSLFGKIASAVGAVRDALHRTGVRLHVAALAPDILDTIEDTQRIYYAGGKSQAQPLAQFGIPLSAGQLTFIGSHVLALAFRGARAAVRKMRGTTNAALTSDQLVELADAYFRALHKAVPELGTPPTYDWLAGHLQAPAANAAEWTDLYDHEKLEAFQKWLAGQMSELLTSDDEEEAWDAYIRSGFAKGAGRAFDDVSKSKAFQAALADKLDFYDGTREQFLRDSFAQPVAKEKVKLLAARSFDEMENVTDDMSNRMSRTLVDGLVRGASPHDIADDLEGNLDFSQARAETVARTEIIRAHSEGQLQALENLGVEEVGVAVEWSTAGDGKVCELCASLEGVVLKLDEAKGLLPRHPNCRCAWLPANVGEDDEDQVSTKTGIDAALKDADLDPGDVGVSPKRPKSILNALYPARAYPWPITRRLGTAAVLANYNPDQPRDSWGRWAGAGAGGPGTLPAPPPGFKGVRVKVHGGSPASAAKRLRAVHGILDRLPPAARRAVRAEMPKVNFYQDPKAVTGAWENVNGARAPKGYLVAGFYDPNDGHMHLDGATEKHGETLEGVFAHELGHAIDGKDSVHSDSKAWRAAWKSEIDTTAPDGSGALSNYARTDPSEGFAEFHRFLMTGDHDTVRIVFPKCWAYWEKRNLIGTTSGSQFRGPAARAAATGGDFGTAGGKGGTAGRPGVSAPARKRTRGPKATTNVGATMGLLPDIFHRKLVGKDGRHADLIRDPDAPADDEPATNAFCPTGPGGGVKPDCPKGGAATATPGGTESRQPARQGTRGTKRAARPPVPSVKPGPNGPAISLLRPEEVKAAKAQGMITGSLHVISTARAAEIRDTLAGKSPGGKGAAAAPTPTPTAKPGQVNPTVYARSEDRPGNPDLPASTWPATLTPAEKGAVAVYTSTEYKELNSTLRSTGSPPPRLAAVHDALDSAFSKVPVHSPITVHRGLNLSGDKLHGFLQSVVSAGKAGEPLKMGGWLSTVPGPKPSQMSMFNVHLTVNATHLLDTIPASRTPFEKEALLHHEATFRPRSIRKEGDTYHIELDQLPPTYLRGPHA